MTGWDGLPQSPDRDGWHWLEIEGGGAKARAPVEWRAIPQRWRASNGELHSAWEKARRWRYIAPCPMPGDDA